MPTAFQNHAWNSSFANQADSMAQAGASNVPQTGRRPNRKK
jgi:hypothetical protein